VSVGAEYLVKALFVLHKANKPKVQVIYLSEPELISLENHQFSQEGLQQVRDMFVFCCYTGLAYQEMANLEEKFIVKGFDNELRIEMNRQKTGKKIAIPLLPKANLILDKYTNDSQVVFEVLSNQKYNSYLRRLHRYWGLKKD